MELVFLYSFNFSFIFLFFTVITKNVIVNANNPLPKKKGKPRCTFSKAVPINGANTPINVANPWFIPNTPLVSMLFGSSASISLMLLNKLNVSPLCKLEHNLYISGFSCSFAKLK